MPPVRTARKSCFPLSPAKFMTPNLGDAAVFRNRDLLVKILVVILVIGMVGSVLGLFLA